jgi:hypothetical protein
MKARIQVVIETGAAPLTVELAEIHRANLCADTLGLHLAEAKAILGGLQKALVDGQTAEAIDAARVCPHCQSPLQYKGHHGIVWRSLFGKLTLRSPRLYRCHCIDDASVPRSFSPLANALPERTSPELQYLQTRFAALMSYGLTVEVLDEILPLGQPLAVDSIRRRVQRVSQRIEARSMEAPPAETAAPAIPAPSPVRAIGIDGGYVRASNAPTPQEGWFEVIVGKSARDNGAGRCFGYVHRLEPSPAQRMQRFLSEEGLQPDHPVIFVSDGGDTVRHAQAGFGAHREYVLDWFHISMRFQNLIQMAKELQESEGSPTREAIVEDLHGAKWHLWHGCPHRALQRFDSLAWDVEAMPDCPAKTKFKAKLEECETYFTNNQDFIVDYGDRYRHGEPIASGFVESAVNQVVAKRFVKRQQMRWSDQNAHQLLQIRTAVLNDELRRHFEQWYPGIAANGPSAAKAA